MESIAKHLSKDKLILRSGGAPGADSAFEQGSHSSLKEIYLPWELFNNNKSSLTSPDPKAFEIAKQVHPCWNKCSGAAKKLHARNVHQILGKDLNSPVSFVIYWAETKNGLVQGGTATAVHLAKNLNIPTHNLKEKTIRKAWENIAKNSQETKKSSIPLL
jgi:hypothetical protein